MIKTGHEIQDDFYAMLRSSSLAGAVSGGVYKNGYRPRDSRLEDIIVTFTTATAGQVQEGVVTLNIYVPDIDPFDNGVMVEDGARTSALEAAASTWFSGIDPSSTGYYLYLQQAPFTMRDMDTDQHFVVMRMSFKSLSD